MTKICTIIKAVAVICVMYAGIMALVAIWIVNRQEIRDGLRAAQNVIFG